MTTTNKNPLLALSGIGPNVAQKLNKIGIFTPADFLFHLPLRYQDRTTVTPISQLHHGEESLVFGQIQQSQIQYGKRRSLLIHIADAHAVITIRFFHFNRSQHQSFADGQYIRCYGEARRYGNRWEMVHPEYKLYSTEPAHITDDTLTPIYPTTEGIGTLSMRRYVQQALTQVLPSLVDVLPATYLQPLGLPSLKQALATIHHPRASDNHAQLLEFTHPAQQRLILEELLAHHLSLRQLRATRKQIDAQALSKPSARWQQLQQQLPFALTAAQHRVIEEISHDLHKSHAMLRMLQGDVGSGKTIVAAAAALLAIDNGYQVALMAPTELLAEQHRDTFAQWLAPLNIEIAWLTGKLTAAAKRETLKAIENGTASLIIGTHALFQQDVHFPNLGLVIVDEQHRFGVEQRLSLVNKSSTWQPHQLIMSATPIPRSLAMIFYADLDVSSIDELPAGRKPTKTVVVSDARRDEVAERITALTEQGFQAYWVCPLIDESDKLQAQAATSTLEDLRIKLPALRIELIHGRMKSTEKERVMQAFVKHEVDLLVATTVIEVGVNVPNANLMVIENAERLGLAQLHQLRGRVGRGGDQATCILMYQSPLGQIAKARLALMRDTNDGFKIAQKDLELRGPGELLGKRQTGIQTMRVANLVRDKIWLSHVEALAQNMIQHHPQCITPLIDRWIVHADQYGNV